MVRPPFATSDVLPDQQVTMDNLDARTADTVFYSFSIKGSHTAVVHGTQSDLPSICSSADHAGLEREARNELPACVKHTRFKDLSRPKLSPTPASPVVQTLDHEDDKDIAEDQPMPPQPLLPARRPRAESATDPVPAAAEAPVERLSLLLRHLLRLCLFRLLLNLLKVLLFQRLKEHVNMTYLLNNLGSLFHTSNLPSNLQHYLHRPVHQRHCHHQILLLH